jgi:hypothetical protein
MSKIKVILFKTLYVLISLLGVAVTIGLYAMPFFIKDIAILRIVCIIIMTWFLLSNLMNFMEEKKQRKIYDAQLNWLTEQLAELRTKEDIKQ